MMTKKSSRLERLMAVLLVMVMVFSMLPTAAFAADTEPPMGGDGGDTTPPTPTVKYHFYQVQVLTSEMLPAEGAQVTIDGKAAEAIGEGVYGLELPEKENYPVTVKGVEGHDEYNGTVGKNPEPEVITLTKTAPVVEMVTLTVNVKDDKGNPLSGATVMLGTVKMTEKKNGTYTGQYDKNAAVMPQVTVSKKDYNNDTAKSFTITAGQTVLDAALKRTSEKLSFTVTVQRQYKNWRGKIKTETVSGAEVFLNGIKKGTTNDDGQLIFEYENICTVRPEIYAKHKDYGSSANHEIKLNETEAVLTLKNGINKLTITTQDVIYDGEKHEAKDFIKEVKCGKDVVKARSIEFADTAVETVKDAGKTYTVKVTYSESDDSEMFEAIADVKINKLSGVIVTDNEIKESYLTTENKVDLTATAKNKAGKNGIPLSPPPEFIYTLKVYSWDKDNGVFTEITDPTAAAAIATIKGSIVTLKGSGKAEIIISVKDKINYDIKDYTVSFIIEIPAGNVQFTGTPYVYKDFNDNLKNNDIIFTASHNGSDAYWFAFSTKQGEYYKINEELGLGLNGWYNGKIEVRNITKLRDALIKNNGKIEVKLNLCHGITKPFYKTDDTTILTIRFADALGSAININGTKGSNDWYTTAPEVSIPAPAEGTPASGNSFAIDDLNFGTEPKSVVLEGEHNIYVKDAAGVIHNNGTVKVDTVAPATPEINTKGSYYYNDPKNLPKITITVPADETSGIASIIIDGNDYTKSLDEDGKLIIENFVPKYDTQEIPYTIKDKAGNISDGSLNSCTFVYDNTKPVISISPVEKFYGSAYTEKGFDITVTIDEANFDEKNTTIAVDNINGTVSVPANWTVSGIVHTKILHVNCGSNNSGEYKITVSSKDKAGNVGENKECSFEIDVTAPKIESVTYSRKPHNVSGRDYYKDQTVTVTIVVAEKNFAPDRTTLKLNDKAQAVNWEMKGETNTGTFTVDAGKGGDKDYKFTLVSMDKAGNDSITGAGVDDKTHTYTSKDFTIDTVAPVAQLTFNQSVHSEGDKDYYAGPIQGTLSITERNFDEEDASVTVMRVNEGNVPVHLSWSHSGSTHTASFTINNEGDYRVSAEVKDRALNKVNVPESKTLVVDMTKPEVNATVNGGDPNGHAYKGNVAPATEIKDINHDKHEIKLIRSTLKNPSEDVTAKLIASHTDGPNGVNVVYKKFDPTDRNMDGYYILTVSAVDKAGNRSEEVVKRFTINNFGSVYSPDDYFRELVKDGGQYRKKITEDLVIKEYNCDQITEKDNVKLVQIYRDDKLIENPEFKANPSLNKEVKRGENGWFEYSYTIGKSNFTEDGVYKIIVTTKDNANNTNSSTTEHTLIFRVDSTPPELNSVVGLEKNIINSAETEVRYTVHDVIGLKSVKIFVDDELVSTVDEFEDMLNYTGSFKLSEKSSKQHVRIVVEDMAENILDTDSEEFQCAFEFNRDVTVSTSFFVRWYANKPLFWGSIAGAAAIIALVIFLVLRRKKDDDEDEAPKEEK